MNAALPAADAAFAAVMNDDRPSSSAGRRPCHTMRRSISRPGTAISLVVNLGDSWATGPTTLTTEPVPAVCVVGPFRHAQGLYRELRVCPWSGAARDFRTHGLRLSRGRFRQSHHRARRAVAAVAHSPSAPGQRRTGQRNERQQHLAVVPRRVGFPSGCWRGRRGSNPRPPA